MSLVSNEGTELGLPTSGDHHRERLVVVGNGMAGVRLLEELVQLNGQTQLDITVFGAEPEPGYNRILLSPVLSGDKTLEQIRLRDADWYKDHGIDLRLSSEVAAIDTSERSVSSADGEQTTYDKLVIATGSTPFIIPLPGHKLDGVLSFRDLNDVDAMLRASQTHKHAVVIGGGLLGLEAADGLLRRGMDVTVVHISDHIMERQLDAEAANMLQNALIDRGIKLELTAHTDCLLGDKRVTGLRFKDGREIPADLVIMAAGVRPNVQLGQQSGLVCERAIVVDDHMRASEPNVFAVGECAQHRGDCYGLVAPLYEQAKVLASQLLGDNNPSYEGSQLATTLKVNGVSLYSAGDFMADAEALVFRDPGRNVYKKLLITDNKLIGAVLYGDIADGPWYFELIQTGRNIALLRSKLIFGKQYAMPAGIAAEAA